uniref:RNA helicase n=1 Tax=Pinguiococcus pyrenoidosus TaxID=172671 RepID=A0A7R9U8F6_9STRA|mmetsp:Transcript_19011/g.71912  ORF Transcript_19011/g.71912 Transcript_19011/m.71912 type:complete len:547 (+) Transcript_19011:64-1704(+)
MAKPDEAPLKKAKKKKAKKVKLKDAGNEPAGPKGSLKRRREENGGQDAASPKKKVKTLKTAGDAAKKKKKKKAKKDKNAAKTAEEKSSSEAVEAKPSEMTAEEVAAFRAEAQINVSGQGAEAFRPFLSFSEAGFPEALQPLIGDFEKPTPIQSECWPILMAGRDMIGVSETGSGKTLAFAIPGILRLRAQSRPQQRQNQAVSPRMLILAPTRELATQCEEVLVSGLAGAGVSVVCTYGGVPKHQQLRRLQKGARSPNGVVVVATPGRLRDLENDGGLVLDAVEYLVLDEADRMLDLGFERDVKAIIANCMPPPERQTVMFSATWPESIRQLAATFLNNPVKITVGTDELTSNHRVQQTVEVIAERDRFQRLRELLNRYHRKKNNRILVFALYKKEAARLESMLQREFRCNSVHGDKSQPERSRAVDDFRNKDCPLLIATDVAARGLDIPDVEVVINYSFPLTIEDYIHRIGRTGRAGKTGVSHTFFHDGNKQLAGSLMNVLREADQEVPSELMRFGAGVKKKEHKLYGAFAADVDMTKKPKKIIFD